MRLPRGLLDMLQDLRFDLMDKINSSTTPADSTGDRPLSIAMPIEKVAIYAALLLIACLGVTEVSHLFEIRFTILDDAHTALMTTTDGGMRSLFQGTSFSQGRFHWLLGVPLHALPLRFEQSAWFNVLHYGSPLLAHLAFFLVLGL